MQPRRSVVSLMAQAGASACKVAVAGGALSLGALYVAQRSLIYPRPAMVADPAAMVKDVEMITLDGEVVCAYFKPPEKTTESPTIVYFHGNADQIGWSGTWLASMFRRKGIGFLAVEYPGYGLSGGSPSETSILAAARKAVEYATTRSSRLVLMGQSIGCAPALDAATLFDVPDLVLLSPFESLPAVASAVLPFLPRPLLRALIHDTFDNVATAKRLSSPPRTLIIHGTHDSIVPFAQGKALSEAIPSSIFIPLHGRNHNDLFTDDLDDHLTNLISNFILSSHESSNPSCPSSSSTTTHKSSD